ncbi:hypothetical protein QQX98_012457 [Neonectria punicea]|uniref:Glucan endo-1,3-alpha-glucosidase agn1 n=1 Tax=Neonectria punicea TaxID=979145 RepID=A0ABR1GIU7_9HYPO
MRPLGLLVFLAGLCEASRLFIKPENAVSYTDSRTPYPLNFTESQFANALGTSYWTATFLTASDHHQYLIVSHALVSFLGDEKPDLTARYSVLDMTDASRLLIEYPSFGFKALADDSVSTIQAWGEGPDFGFNFTFNATTRALCRQEIGNIDNEHCRKDILDAQNLGIDAFAINFDQYAWWSNGTVDRLFDNADELGFKIFFSFDMSGSYFSSPDQYAAYLDDHLSRESYYTYNGRVIPSFYQSTPSSTFFDKYPELDGMLNWNSWPQIAEGKIIVSTDDDKTYQQAAKNSGKLFMMGLSPLQFKHFDPNNNWYRIGEQNLEYRFGQVLEVQPDMLEIQTWNDAGESHYMGNIWPEAMDGDAIPAYTDGYDHTGYWEVLPSFIQAWKRGDTTTEKMVPTNGARAQGVFWHHTLLTTADCSSDGLGKPDGINNAENVVTGVILVAEGQTGLTVSALSGSAQLGTKDLVPGFNRFTFTDMTTGTVSVRVLSGDGVLAERPGPLQVLGSSSVCNYNYQVVGLSA